MHDSGLVDLEQLVRRVMGEMRSGAVRLVRGGFQRAFRIGGPRAGEIEEALSAALGLGGSELWEAGAEMVMSSATGAAALAGEAAAWVATDIVGPAYRLTRTALAAYGQRPQSSTVSDVVLGVFGVEPAGWEWVYGDALRDTFQAHSDLDGVRFTEWDDPKLALQPRDALWMVRTHYAIDDHAGCECHAVRVVAD